MFSIMQSNYHFTEEIRERIRYLSLNSDKTVREISEDVGRNYNGVNTLINKESLPRTKSNNIRKYPLDENFFDIIDCEEKAYFLGLLLADGYNNLKDGVILLDLMEDDFRILQKLADLIQPEKPIRKYSSCKNKPNVKDKYRISIVSKKMSKQLLAFGMTNNKSEDLVFVDNIPTILLNHFVRGYFDGDGSFGIYGKSKTVEFSICSTKEFLESIQKILIVNCGLNKTKFGKRHKNRDSNSYHMKYGGRNNCLKIRDWLYKDANYYILRKQERFFTPLLQ